MLRPWISLLACAGLLFLFLPDPAPGQGLSQNEVAAQWRRAQELAKLGRFAEAAAVYEQLVPSAETVYGKSSKNTARILNDLGIMCANCGQHAKAEPYYQRSLQIFETTEGKGSSDVANTLANLALLYQDLGQFDAADPLYQRSLQIQEANLGPNHLKLALPINNQAELYHRMGLYTKAEQLFQRSLQIYTTNVGNDHLDGVPALTNLANLYRNTGRYAKAEPLYLRCVKIREANLDKHHPKVALSCYNLASFYQYMGDYAAAEPLFVRSLEIWERGSNHSEVAFALFGLAHLYSKTGKNTKAEPLYQRSLQILEAKSKNPTHVATALNNLAGLYDSMGQHAKAEPLYLRSLQIYETNLGKDHPNVATALGNLAGLYHSMGQNDKAQPLYERCLRINQTKLGSDHLDVTRSMHNLARNSAHQQDWGKAVDHFQKARQGTANHLAVILPSLNEKEQLTLLQANFERGFHRALSLGWSARTEGAAPSAEWLLNGKAVAHQSLAEQTILARDAQDPKARQLVESLQQTRSRLAALVNLLPKPGREAEYQKEVQSLKASEHALAQKLARTVERPYRDNPWIPLDQLRARLGPQTAFVDIARFSVFDFNTNKPKGPHYVAWITPPAGKGDVQIIDLGAADPIDQLVAQTRKALLDSAKSITKVGEIEALEAFQQPLAVLSAKVLHPLLPTLGKYEEWIICPDAALWLTPWSALLLRDGKFAVEQHLVRHVVSGRDLVLELPESKNKGAYVFADPDYDLNPGKVMLAAGAKQGVNDDIRFTSAGLGTLPRVPRLPGTALEADAIRPKLKQWLGQDPTVYLESEASETLVKKVKRPRVLTLATHGYFLARQDSGAPDRPDSDVDRGHRSAALFDKAGQAIENPLLRCGLLFAGCNKRFEAKQGEDDGVLTGLEIVGMNLNGCELVVLSACETGLGDVRSGEGLAGLRQAFQLAGAKSVLASLWQVPDRETALLMNTFYGEIAKGRSQAMALRQAQLQRIAARRDQFGAAHPFSWAAFSLTSRGE